MLRQVPSLLVRQAHLQTLKLVPSAAMSMPTGGGGMGEMGSGAGKGGGSGGSIREAGGAFGKMEAAREEEYFRRLQKEQLKNLQDEVDRELEYHDQQIRHHQAAVERHKKRAANLEREEKNI